MPGSDNLGYAGNAARDRRRTDQLATLRRKTQQIWLATAALKSGG
jgi:hypothetical protein